MSSTIDFYLAQAEQCASAAALSDLDNVRERHLRSERAWRALAEQLLYADRLRKARELERDESAIG